jgi:peptidoglycan/xylan/chitin deacetylase (PgdA/CDA1 family)
MTGRSRRAVLGGGLLTVALLVLALLWTRPPPGPRSARLFDPDRLAELEVEMWQAYYRRQKTHLFATLVVALREQFRYPWSKATRAAYHLARAAARFAGSTGGYERVLPDLRAAYAIARGWTGAGFDVDEVARAELAWWVARRDSRTRQPENVGQLIAALYGKFYELPPGRVDEAGLLRARAADLRDRGAAAEEEARQHGTTPPPPDWAEVSRLLHASYRALHDALGPVGALGDRPSLALTFDDATPDAATNRGILAALAAAHLKSILFVAGANVDSPAGLRQVRAWGEAGHAIGNHTYAHHNLDRTPLPEFEADVMRDHALLAELPGFVRLFRFPYLHQGERAEVRDGCLAFLRAAGYRDGGVTIDSSDWYYAERYRRWKRAHPGADPAPFRQAYLEHLWGRAQYYEALARRVVGRPVHHTLLLHTTPLNAAMLPAVIEMFSARGWRLLDAADAFTDPIFQLEARGLPANQGVVWSLARTAGVPGLRYPPESDTYEKGTLDAAGL